jgi:butyrate kinase
MKRAEASAVLGGAIDAIVASHALDRQLLTTVISAAVQWLARNTRGVDGQEVAKLALSLYDLARVVPECPAERVIEVGLYVYGAGRAAA